MREPTRWTLPLQVAVAAYFVVAVAVMLFGAFAPGTRAAFETSFRHAAQASSSGNLTQQEAVRLAGTFFAGFASAVIAIAVLELGLALAGFRRWTWVFVIDIGLLAVGSIGLFFTLLRIAAGRAARASIVTEVLSLAVGLLGLAVLIALIVSAMRIGAWACRRSTGVGAGEVG